MALSVEQIKSASSDEKLLDLLLAELRVLFPPQIRNDPIAFHWQLQSSPRGLRAMASTYELDVSLALDDLAWHFVNHHNLQALAEETALGLRELGELEAAEIFGEAFALIKPHWEELQLVESRTAHAWLDATGIQNLINPLNERMWNIRSRWPNESLMSCWAIYARKNPDRCINQGGSNPTSHT